MSDENLLTQIKALGIELRGIKYAAFASDETSCFEATVYIGGKKCGTVSNEGQGGPDHFHPHTLETQLNELVKDFPAIVTEYDDPKDTTGKMTLKVDAELICGELLDEWLQAKDRKRLENKLRKDLAKHLMFTRKSKDGLFVIKGAAERLMALADDRFAVVMAKHNPDMDVCLNKVPFADAFALFMKHGVR